jgi:hypothetical protein
MSLPSIVTCTLKNSEQITDTLKEHIGASLKPDFLLPTGVPFFE